MATVEKIRRDIEKTKEKISEQQKRLRSLEAQLVEEENLEIVRMVKAVKMDNRELTAFLKAYASGLITLPEGMMEAEARSVPRLLRSPPLPAAGRVNLTTPKRRLTSRRMTEPRKSRFPMMKILPAAIMRRPAVTPWTSSPNCWAAWEP